MLTVPPLSGMLARDQVVGRSVRTSRLEAAISGLSDIWLSNLHTSADGRVGWYRILNRAERVGDFASAQAIVALTASGAPVPDLEDVVASMIRTRLSTGGWAFLSTLNDVDVVDTTAWVLMALSQYRHEPTLSTLELPRVLDDVAERLAQLALPQGGWGLVGGAAFRAYSTALAIRALCAAGRERSLVVQAGIQALLACVDPGAGAWRDSSGRISVPVTAEVIRAFRAVAGSRQRHALTTDRAARWLLSISASSELWSAGPYVASTEEVEIGSDAQLRRIDFGFSPRPAAVTALLESGRPVDAAVVHAVADILAGQQEGDWSRVSGTGRHEPRSWMLHDACIAISSFRARLSPSATEVWANRRRVVVLDSADSAPVRFVRRRWIGLLLAGGSIGIAVLLQVAGVVHGVGLATVAFAVSTITLGVLTNVLSEYLVGVRRD